MNIIVIGKSGQLAWELNNLSSTKHHIICLGRHDINISDIALTTKILKKYKADAVINASAYTAVDQAETDVDNAYMLNATAVGNLTQVCKALAISLLHISTDFVFQGDKGSPYLPTDIINPLGTYGESKAEGEKLALQLYSQKTAIIRTSWVYSTHGNNFVKTMLNLMKIKPELGIISDQIGTPTYAKGLAETCILAVEQSLLGIHHYTDSGVASWFDFAIAIQKLGLELGLLDKKIPIKPISTSQYPTPAKRPHYSVLDKSSLVTALPDVSLSYWQEQLQQMMLALKADNH